ncbi:MAG TPA: hemerythrin domain-containing protein [Kofleriaceae bacterium]
MKDTIDVLELLESQHGEVDQLIEDLERGRGDRAALFAELADKVAAHSAVEEKIFYPAAMAPNTEELLHEFVEDHLTVKRLLADMMEMDPDDEDGEFDETLALLKDEFDRHSHDQEEGRLFPRLRRMMSADERAGLGNEVLAMFEWLIDQEPRRDVPRETAEPAPLPPP